jgi:hypothetical protein
MSKTINQDSILIMDNSNIAKTSLIFLSDFVKFADFNNQIILFVANLDIFSIILISFLLGDSRIDL